MARGPGLERGVPVIAQPRGDGVWEGRRRRPAGTAHPSGRGTARFAATGTPDRCAGSSEIAADGRSVGEDGQGQSKRPRLGEEGPGQQRQLPGQERSTAGAEQRPLGWVGIAARRRHLGRLGDHDRNDEADGTTKTFTPTDDQIVESLLNELSAHAGQESEHRPSQHGSGDVNLIAEEIAGWFPGSSTTGDIYDFIQHGADAELAKGIFGAIHDFPF